MALEIIEALEKVGDGSCVLPVERLMQRSRETTVCAAAARLLPLLQQRRAEEDALQLLLRASTVQSSAPDMLLRPSGMGLETDPKQLLRASAGNQS